MKTGDVVVIGNAKWIAMHVSDCRSHVVPMKRTEASFAVHTEDGEQTIHVKGVGRPRDISPNSEVPVVGHLAPDEIAKHFGLKTAQAARRLGLNGATLSSAAENSKGKQMNGTVKTSKTEHQNGKSAKNGIVKNRAEKEKPAAEKTQAKKIGNGSVAGASTLVRKLVADKPNITLAELVPLVQSEFPLVEAGIERRMKTAKRLLGKATRKESK